MIALGISSLIVLAIASIVVLSYGWVPQFGNRVTEVYFGEKPESWVAWYGSGWTDHQIYFVFRADRDWVERAASHAGLAEAGEMHRNDCVGISSRPPWWFVLSPRTEGICWKRINKRGGDMRMHYSPASDFVYVYDYSS